MKRGKINWVWLLSTGLMATVGAGATELTANRDISGGAVLTASPDSITPQSDGLTYRWSDKNGDGTADDPVAPGLNLAAYSLTRSTDTIGFVLDLNDGTTDGVISWGGASGGRLSTYRETSGDKDGGPITITGATDIACSEINASGRGTGHGGDVVVAHSGNLTVSNVWARPANNRTGGRIALTGAGGTSGTPAGWCRIVNAIESHVSTTAGATKEIAIAGYDKVTVGAGGIRNYQWSSANLNHVTISNIGPGGVEVAGPIHAHVLANNGKGDVDIQTQGNVQLTAVDTHRGSGGEWVYYDSGRITIAASGNVEIIGALHTYMLGDNGSGSYSRNAGNVTIVSAGGRVHLADVITTNKQNNSARYAGDVTVTAADSVTVTGALDLYSPYGGDRRGDLSLTSTGGGVMLAGLNLERLNVARLTSGQGWGAISGALSNFSTNHTGGAGTAGSPFVTTQTQLRLPAGQRLYYTHVPGGINDGLGGYAYQVRNLDDSGPGGVLMVQALVGTVFRFQ